MSKMNEKTRTLHELATTLAALKNPQCHYDLTKEDVMLLNIKIKEIEDLFYLVKNSNDN